MSEPVTEYVVTYYTEDSTKHKRIARSFDTLMGLIEAVDSHDGPTDMMIEEVEVSA